ncbi:hypothetical protein [Amycolatopsis regifaucium]|uniref:Uncharacterized protein n=1 Tax=Amycolatopsis regifaucium TaxID=546365 RepID=A0A154MAB8_9PSEU|nr:hypothetical protein [Amycolatopsis regifaucium]KZB81476.1 hypothetical protein AVL48_05555 [Amycolatopsis regifaucium]OKA04739.1 hypothetical protein ATP06_0230570 [Amycolatopsis regifaucium]SFH30379.1 hypothetical protein SAMN04489731_103437 [Amycolatopsis regifaucium]
MPATEINGDIEAMSAYSSKLKAPEMPPSMARLGIPPNLSGLYEGIAMSVLDKAATAAMSALLTKVTEDMVTDSVKVKAAAGAYSAADVASALELATSATKVIKQGVGLVKQVAGSGQQAVEKPADQPAAEITPTD